MTGRALSAEFEAARQAAGDRIVLRLGIELGDAPWALENTERLLAQAPPLDFVIGSIHMLSERYDGMDLYFFDPPNEAEARRGMADYLGQVRKLAEWGKFSVLGHLTLPVRYLNENRGFHLTFDGFEAEMEEILRILIQQGRGIELNTNRGNTPLPDAKWLRMYRSLGGEIITLGTDAPQQALCRLRHPGAAATCSGSAASSAFVPLTRCSRSGTHWIDFFGRNVYNKVAFYTRRGVEI